MKLTAVSTVVAATAALLLATPGTAAAVVAVELAQRWAPIHYQDTDSSDYDADYLSRINYDSEWDTLNNWEQQDDQLSRLTGCFGTFRGDNGKDNAANAYR